MLKFREKFIVNKWLPLHNFSQVQIRSTKCPFDFEWLNCRSWATHCCSNALQISP